MSNCASSPPISDGDTSVTNAWCNTRIKSSTINYTWTVNNFSLRPEKIGESFQSPLFSDGSNEYAKWNLRIFPKGDNDRKEWAKYELSISNNIRKRCIFTTNEVEHDFISGAGCGCPFIRLDTLLDPSKNLLPDDILIVSCKVSFSSNSTDICGSSNVFKIVVPQSKIFQDYGNLFENGKLSDVTIIVGGREIRAHKAILAARSSYFAAMFKHKTRESQLNSILITDVEPDVLKEMLNFIYTDKAPNLAKMAAKLLPAADKYALERLKAMSEESLQATLSIDNAIEILTLADRQSAVQLKSYAKEFIKSHISEIIETNCWENLINTQIQQMLPSIDLTKLDKEGKTSTKREAHKHFPYSKASRPK